MEYRPERCLLPELLRERKIDPVIFYIELGWSKQQYSAYVNHHRYMSAGTLKTVAEKLGLPMDDIYTWKAIPLRKGRGTSSE